ncbi:MAG: hypothetical protein ACYDAD_14375, partial [Acidimicrobiales bacterium]
TDREFWHDMVIGMLVGTPMVWLLSMGIALIAGIRLDNAALMGIVPALFCATFYGGLIPLMGRLIRAGQTSLAAVVAPDASPVGRPFPRAA